jgi:speckle-type POZ protein
MAKHLGQLLASGEGADVTFRVGGESFPAHRQIVAARSPVLKALLAGTHLEASAAEVELAEVEPSVFGALLHFLYTEELPEELRGEALSCEAAQHLLVAGDRWEVHELLDMCATRLSETLEVDTAADTLVLAQQHGTASLKPRCVAFFAAHAPEVMATEGWAHLLGQVPELTTELITATWRRG